MRTTRTVSSQLEELRRGYAELKAQLAELLSRGGTAASGAFLPGLAGRRLKIFLKESRMNEREFYRLRARGKLRCVTVADRQVFVVMQSYTDYIAALDAEQNGPGGTPRPVKNPPPVPRRRDRDIGGLAATLPPDTGPPPGS